MKPSHLSGRRRCCARPAENRAATPASIGAAARRVRQKSRDRAKLARPRRLYDRSGDHLVPKRGRRCMATTQMGPRASWVGVFTPGTLADCSGSAIRTTHLERCGDDQTVHGDQHEKDSLTKQGRWDREPTVEEISTAKDCAGRALRRAVQRPSGGRVFM